jgi:hypothetical protein
VGSVGAGGGAGAEEVRAALARLYDDGVLTAFADGDKK